MVKPFNTRALVAALAEHLREIATRQDNIPFRTGQLRKSIISAVLSDTEAIVGSDKIYARAVHDGAIIRPKHAKALVFKAPPGWRGRKIKNTDLAVARKVTIKPNPFLARAVETFTREPLPYHIRQMVGEEAARALEAHFRAAGLEVKRS
jgi:hypothetical protein